MINTQHALIAANKEKTDVNTSDHTPTPGDLAKAFKSAGEAVEKVTEQIKDLGEKANPKQKTFERPEHLTHRPFQHSDALRNLQSSLHRRDNQKQNPKATRQR